VLFSIIAGISGLQDASKIGRLGGKTIAMYVATTLTSVIVGLLLVNLIQPGNKLDDESRLKNRIRYELWAGSTNNEIKDDKRVLDNPKNNILAQQVALTVEAEKKLDGNKKIKDLQKKVASQKDSGPMQFLVDMVPTNIFTALGDGKLMLQVIFFAIFFGIALIMITNDKLLGRVIAICVFVWMGVYLVISEIQNPLVNFQGMYHYIIPIGLGYLSHIVGDSLTPAGCYPLYPSNYKFQKKEAIIIIGLWFLAVVYLLLKNKIFNFN